MKTYNLFIDGASFNNGHKNPDKPVYGSFAGVILDENYQFSLDTIKKKYEDVTNNQMEIFSFIYCVSKIIENNLNDEPIIINVHSDSQYLVKGCTEWLYNWKSKDWKDYSNNPVKNKKLWMTIDYLLNNFESKIQFNFTHIKGHQGKNVKKEENTEIYYNEYCDSSATEILKLDELSNFNESFNEVIATLTKFENAMKELGYYNE